MFVKIKKAIDESLNVFFLSEDKKNTSILLNELSKDKDIMKAYVAINNIENPPQIPTDTIKDFLQENLKLVSGLKNKENKETLKKFQTEIEQGSLYDFIETFLFEERNALNFDKHIKAEKFIIEHITCKISSQTENILQGLNEEDKKSCLNYIANPKEHQEKLIDECLNILSEKVQNENDLETKLLIYETKDKLMQEKINKDSTKNVIDFLTLKNNLLNE